ncbi:hypothetical protein SAMN03080617_00273 [Algoriphagus alkaliphilus]|uniref:Transcriptional regulator, AbiEi antitoxin, Type IV TA system n=1 Tax=Algoriphagus alkaliphilus TaxID=279824 RepID=A0A1G5V406_9BACT|nr:hypothetical protein [Algoriphagus alkaliphilus]SDA39735.1 hypothetical protein SAMN03080617_00273 [Algoriphagus alkaliphilus]
MKTLEKLKGHLQRGNLYRRSDLEQWSTSVDRHLRQLVAEGTLQKMSQGLYYFPKETDFGPAPPDESSLVQAFLKDDNFLIFSPNDYNSLRVGTTQLYNKRIVYNHKRHGEFELGGRKFFFHMKPKFPKKLTPEFLLVDLVNNLDTLAEDQNLILCNILIKTKIQNISKMKQNVTAYGGLRAKKILLPILEETLG